MVRDFLGFLIGRADTVIAMPGTGERVDFGRDWLSRAQIAYRHAVSACLHEEANRDGSAGETWQQIFGTVVPRQVA